MTYDPLAYWEERAKANGETYVAKANSQEHWNREYSDFAPRLVSLVPFCDRLLDFGCGSGRFTGLLSTKTKSYVGADISEEGIALAQARYPGTEYIALGRGGLPMEDEYFDVIVCVFVLQHMVQQRDYNAWAKEFSRVSRPSGSIIVIDRDPWPEGSPVAHMNPRGPQAFAEATGSTLDRQERANVDHWAGRFLK